MAKRILVPLDGSESAEAALPLAGDLAARAGGSVHLLRVAPRPKEVVDETGRVIAFVDQEMGRLAAEAQDYLHAAAMRLGTTAADTAVRFGDPVTEILAEAQEAGADLIVMATGEPGAVRRALLGSVAEHVFGKAPVPMLLYRAPGAA